MGNANRKAATPSKVGRHHANTRQALVWSGNSSSDSGSVLFETACISQTPSALGRRKLHSSLPERSAIAPSAWITGQPDWSINTLHALGVDDVVAPPTQFTGDTTISPVAVYPVASGNFPTVIPTVPLLSGQKTPSTYPLGRSCAPRYGNERRFRVWSQRLRGGARFEPFWGPFLDQREKRRNYGESCGSPISPFHPL